LSFFTNSHSFAFRVTSLSFMLIEPSILLTIVDILDELMVQNFRCYSISNCILCYLFAKLISYSNSSPLQISFQKRLFIIPKYWFIPHY
jgi:hypothetical protein